MTSSHCVHRLVSQVVQGLSKGIYIIVVRPPRECSQFINEIVQPTGGLRQEHPSDLDRGVTDCARDILSVSTLTGVIGRQVEYRNSGIRL
jgi:hypothetical protein